MTMKINLNTTYEAPYDMSLIEIALIIAIIVTSGGLIYTKFFM